MATECIPRTNRRWFPKVDLRISLQKKKSKLSRSSSSSSSSSESPRCLSSPSSLTPKGRTREAELRDVFDYFDTNKDGNISALELRRYFASVGDIMSDEHAQEVIDELDSDKDGMLDFDDFVKLMDSKEGAEDDLKKVFEMFVHDKGSGRITPKGLQRALTRLGDSKSYQECAAMINVFDIDGDGELDFNEFHQMMAA